MTDTFNLNSPEAFNRFAHTIQIKHVSWFINLAFAFCLYYKFKKENCFRFPFMW